MSILPRTVVPMDLTWMEALILLVAITGIALLYSSVGHGGATGYLAAMSLMGVAPTLARPGALWMNVFVASVAFWRFRKSGLFDGRIFVPLACASIPLAWLGSHLHLEGRVYAGLLGVALLAAGALLGWGQRKVDPDTIRPVGWGLALMAGAALGFLAGMTGIGGGVYLTPLLIFLRWTPAKVAGGISALFIVVNSIAGLIGLGKEALVFDPVLALAPALGVAAAFLGAHFSVFRWNSEVFRRVLAVVLFIAAGKNLLKVLVA